MHEIPEPSSPGASTKSPLSTPAETSSPLNPLSGQGEEARAHADMKVRLGRATWTLLHTIAAKYPEHPDPIYQAKIQAWLELLPDIYPCDECSVHMQLFFKKFPPEVRPRRAFRRCFIRACLYRRRAVETLLATGYALFTTRSTKGLAIHCLTVVDGRTPGCPLLTAKIHAL